MADALAGLTYHTEGFFMTRKMYELEVFANQDGEISILQDDGQGLVCFTKEQAETVAKWILEVAKELGQ